MFHFQIAKTDLNIIGTDSPKTPSWTARTAERRWYRFCLLVQAEEKIQKRRSLTEETNDPESTTLSVLGGLPQD
jgi:hypothetical protein